MLEAPRATAPSQRLLDRPVHQDLRERLSENADGIVEKIAEEFAVTPFDVTRALPADHVAFVDGERFEEVMTALSAWGPVLVIVHTADIVLEVKGKIPTGTFGRGYYNIHCDSPIGGHIRAERCEAIAFVMRPFMGRQSASVQFFSCDGAAMFKVFVRRDEQRELIAEQLEQFRTLRDELCGR